jgi:hypothetical protein
MTEMAWAGPRWVALGQLTGTRRRSDVTVTMTKVIMMMMSGDGDD